jgi:hypothetical protein
MVLQNSEMRIEMLCALHARRYFRTMYEYMVRPSVGKRRHIYISSAPSVMKPCSHVTCKTCTDTLVRPGNQCVVCDKLLAEGDVLELKREGKSSLPAYGYFFLKVFPQARVMQVVGWPRPRNKGLLSRDKCSYLTAITHFHYLDQFPRSFYHTSQILHYSFLKYLHLCSARCT